MLKRKIGIIALLMVIILALTLPIVKAEDMQDTTDDDLITTEEPAVTEENTDVTTQEQITENPEDNTTRRRSRIQKTRCLSYRR